MRSFKKMPHSLREEFRHLLVRVMILDHQALKAHQLKLFRCPHRQDQKWETSGSTPLRASILPFLGMAYLNIGWRYNASGSKIWRCLWRRYHRRCVNRFDKWKTNRSDYESGFRAWYLSTLCASNVKCLIHRLCRGASSS